MTHHDPHDAPREREVIVTDGGGRGGGGAGAVIAAVIGVLVVLLLVFLLFGGWPGGGDGETGDTTNIEAPELPSEVDVNVNEGGEGGGEG